MRTRIRRSRRTAAGQPSVTRLVLFVIGVVTPIGILVVNGAAFVMRNLAQFRIGIAALALVSSLVLNGLAASWLLRVARRMGVRVYLTHPDWAIILATVLVLATSFGAAYFTWVGMRDPAHLPDGIAVLTACLALVVPLGLTYIGRLLEPPEVREEEPLFGEPEESL
jgi:hypothetical protein